MTQNASVSRQSGVISSRPPQLTPTVGPPSIPRTNQTQLYGMLLNDHNQYPDVLITHSEETCHHLCYSYYSTCADSVISTYLVDLPSILLGCADKGIQV